MSQVRREISSLSDSPNGDPKLDQMPFPSPSTDQDETSCPPCTQNPAVAPPVQCSPEALRSQRPATEEEKKTSDDDASQLLANGMASPQTKPEPDFAVAAEAVTRQPQGRAAVQGHQTTDYTPLLQNGAGRVPDPGRANGEAGNGVLFSDLTSLSSSQKPHRKLQSHHSINSQSSKKSSSKSASSQIPTEAQEDCCVHCILSCLFCEFLTLCNIMLDCATCGSCSSEDSCICCCCSSGECTDCDLPCDMDCGIIDACCESADCLEICMECCGLCFSS